MKNDRVVEAHRTGTADVLNFKPLPDVDVKPGQRKGRVPREGYQRGWGLQFGDLLQLVAEEGLFKHAKDSMLVPSWLSDAKRANIYLIMTRFLPKLADRDVIEFGSYKGGNALFMASVLREVAPEATVYALDTFSGMPKTDKDIDAHTEGDFHDSSVENLIRAIERLSLKNIIPVKGLFDQTFPGFSAGKAFGLAHIDADIYSAIKYAQDAVWPVMTKGGYVIYDDADVSSCLGATEAVEELIRERNAHSEQIWPHFVFRANL